MISTINYLEIIKHINYSKNLFDNLMIMDGGESNMFVGFGFSDASISLTLF